MKLCFLHRYVALVLAWYSGQTLSAQAPASPPPAKTPAPTPAQAVLKARLAGQAQRARLLGSEIHNADLRIEARFDDLLTTLRVVSDSKDSHTKVTRMKEETIASLQKAVTYYQQKRAWLEEQMVRPTFNLTQTQKQMISNDFEERIEKRVKQIVDLFKTFPKHEEFERYKATGINSFGGVSYEDSEDYRQNLRLSSHTSTMRSKLIKDIQASINQLDQENLTLADMASKAANPELGEVYGDEQRKNEQLRDVLKENLEAIKAGPTAPGRPVSGHEAQALDKVIKHSVDSLQAEFTLLFSRYADWLTAASALNTLRAAVAKP